MKTKHYGAPPSQKSTEPVERFTYNQKEVDVDSTPQTAWEESFDEKFRDSFSGGDMNCWETAEPIKVFVSSLLSHQQSELCEMVEGMKLKENGRIRLNYAGGKEYEVEAESDRMIFYNQALDDLLSKLDTRK